MRIVVAPDGFGGSLSPREASEAIADGWSRVRPGDGVELVPMSDGGEGLIEAVSGPSDTWVPVEVAGPSGHPQTAGFVLRDDGSAIVESARACGLALVPEPRTTPLLTTTYGVGELLDAARRSGVRRILLGLGGSATVDGGAGALTALGFRLRVADGSGLKIGGGELARIACVERAWASSFASIELELLADVSVPLLEAPERFGPQKGAGPADVEHLRTSLRRWADVLERDLGAASGLRERAGSGAAGGLAYGLAAGIGGAIVTGAARVGELVGLEGSVTGAGVVVTGEGRLDATSSQGKVVDHVARLARRAGARAFGVVGQLGAGAPELDDLEVASPHGPGPDPAAEVAEAASRLASRFHPAQPSP